MERRSQLSTPAPSSQEQEREHFDDLWGRLGRRAPPITEKTFAPIITPAHLPGGAPGGLQHLRAYELLTAEGLEGKVVLDYACGIGQWAIRLAQLGATVRGFDLSPVGIELARAQVDASPVPLAAEFEVASAERLPYDDESFDLVAGIGALHHVIKYPGTADELWRVMRPGATAVFTENLGHNPLIQLARRWTMRGNDAGDVILTVPMVRSWGRRFSSVDVWGCSLLTMAKRVIPTRRTTLGVLHKADEALFTIAPKLRKYGGESVISLVK
jgi:ubiquinone/menaquinone biosynthesis C-methylase UbiE